MNTGETISRDPPFAIEKGRWRHQVSDVVEMGDSVLLTFTFDVYNFSDADVSNAQVVLSDWLDLDAYGSASDISIADRGKVRIQGEVEVDANDYERWHVGASPFLYIEFQNGFGNTFRRPVELAQSLLGGE